MIVATELWFLLNYAPKIAKSQSEFLKGSATRKFSFEAVFDLADSHLFYFVKSWFHALDSDFLSGLYWFSFDNLREGAFSKILLKHSILCKIIQLDSGQLRDMNQTGQILQDINPIDQQSCTTA